MFIIRENTAQDAGGAIIIKRPSTPSVILSFVCMQPVWQLPSASADTPWLSHGLDNINHNSENEETRPCRASFLRS